MMSECLKLIRSIDKIGFVVLLSVVFLQISCTSNTSTKATKLARYGLYSGDISFNIDTVNNVTFALINSSSSQVYEEDNSFDCKLLLIETTAKNDSLIYFEMYNVGSDKSENCGQANLLVLNDTTLRLTMLPIIEKIGVCNRSIDFKSGSLLTFQKTTKEMSAE